MTDDDVRRRLIGFLDEHVFNPVLKAQADKFSADKQPRLLEAQKTMRRERERVQACPSAFEVYRMFEYEVSSEETRKLRGVLRDLGLPTLEDVWLDFVQMAGDLGLPVRTA